MFGRATIRPSRWALAHISSFSDRVVIGLSDMEWNYKTGYRRLDTALFESSDGCSATLTVGR